MRPIRVKIKKIGSRLYLRVPKMIAEHFHIMDEDEMEISIHSHTAQIQRELWETEPDDIRSVKIPINHEAIGQNQYNRIYIPVRFRFFFPPHGIDFLMRTNAGNIRTHLTADGFLKKDIRKWFNFNGPLGPGDQLQFKSVTGELNIYELNYIKV